MHRRLVDLAHELLRIVNPGFALMLKRFNSPHLLKQLFPIPPRRSALGRGQAQTRGRAQVLIESDGRAEPSLTSGGKAVWQIDAEPVTPSQSISSGIFRFGGGNALSSSLISRSVSSISSAARFSRTCSGRLAFGIATMSGWRSNQARAT